MRQSNAHGFCGLAIIAIAIAIVVAAAPVMAYDDWQVVEHHSNDKPASSNSSTPAKSASGAVTMECGERARPATDPYKSIVAQLNDMYGTSFPVYESVAQISPHANSHGCIFYNRQYLGMLLGTWMNIHDPGERSPMLYAIFAHELGHLVHGDFDSSNESVPLKTKELGADQFAGYTMERLGIRRLDSDEVTRYYQLTGDDFVGHSSDHGNGEERTAAFQDGWHRAEVGLPEESSRPAGFGQP